MYDYSIDNRLCIGNHCNTELLPWIRYAVDLRGTQNAASMLVLILGIKLVMGPSLISYCSLCFIQRYLVGKHCQLH